MKKIAIPLVVIILAGLFFVWWLKPENVLERRTKSFFSTAEVPTLMSQISRSTRGPKLANFLTDTIDVEAPKSVNSPVGSTLSRDNFAALYSSLAKHCRQISFEDLKFISIEITDDEAVVVLSLFVRVELPSHKPVDGIQLMTLSWVRSDEHGWRVNSAAWTESDL